MNDARMHAAASGAKAVVLEDEAPVSGAKPSWAVVGIFFFLLMAALAYGRSFLMPVALAVLLMLVFSPIRRWLDRKLHFPTAISAVVIVGSLVAVVLAALAMLAAPAAQWVNDAPSIGLALQEKVSDLRAAADGMRQAAEQVDQIAGGGAPPSAAQQVIVDKPGIVAGFAATAPAILAQIVLTLVLLYFLLASGDMIYEKIVYVLPSFGDKRRAMRIAHDIERKLSRYLLTITIINAALGLCVGLAMWWLAMPEPLLIGTVAFVLNFIPYVGAVAGIGLATVVALVTLPGVGQAFPWAPSICV